jgi:hypothetical protein
VTVAFEGLPAYAFTPAAVRRAAPEQSGVFAIFTSSQWVFIGESANIRQALFDLLNVPNECIQLWHPLSFSWEHVSQSDRSARRQALITNLQPACNESGRAQ